MDLTLTKDKIRFFLEDLRTANLADRNCQKRIIDIFVNAIYLYDDKIDLVLNYYENNNLVTLDDIQHAKADKEFECEHQAHTEHAVHELKWLKTAFIVSISL